MSGLLWGVAAALAVLLLLTLAVLATPVKLGLVLDTAPRWRLRISARLLGGLTPAISLHDSARPKREEKKEKEAPPPARKKRKPAVSRRGRATRAIAAAPRLAADLLRPIQLERLTVDGDLGLADPADTGQLFGWLAAVRYARPASSVVSIDLRPDFTSPRTALEAAAVLSVVPVAFLPPATRFAWRVFGPRS